MADFDLGGKMKLEKMIIASVVSGVIVSMIMRSISPKPAREITGSVNSGTYV